MKNTNLFLTLCVLFSSVLSYGQIHNNSEIPTSINNDGNAPNASAILDVQATDKGMLTPRMNKTARDLISSPATGLLIYQTDSNPGFYYYDGSRWASGQAPYLPITNQSSSYTVQTTDIVNLGDAVAISFTYALPTAVGNDGLALYFKKIDASFNTITLDGNGAETIEGKLVKVLYSRYDYLKIISDGSNWVILENGIKNRSQARLLATQINADNNDIAELKFTNLVVGRIYQINMQARITATSGSTGTLLCYHDGAVLCRVNHDDDGVGIVGTSSIFTAITTDLIFTFDEQGSSSLTANATEKANTFVELEDITETHAITTELD